jgi:predicted Zn-dependent protease
MRLRTYLSIALLTVTAACAVNPATGRRELSLVSEAQEIQMGRDADPEVTASIGLVDDPALQSYVSSLGLRMAASSERPQLPWSFKVVDDPVVNAFAIPGGFIYVMRQPRREAWTSVPSCVKSVTRSRYFSRMR